MTTKNEIWNRIKRNIQGDISKSEFKTWLSQTSLKEISPELAVIEVPNKFVATWLSDNYSEHIQRLLQNDVRTHPTIQFSYGASQSGKTEKRERTGLKSKASFSHGLNPSHTFSDFITAHSNRLACSSALEVANNPSYEYNPLYIFSKRSLGKTHLLHAIGNEAMKRDPEKKAIYLSAKHVISQFEKTSNDELESFWGEENPPQFLLLDDIQTVASHRKSKRELLSLCRLFLESKRQLVVAATTPPSQIKNLLPELRSRLEWGLITEIKKPNAQFFLASSTNDLKNLAHQIQKIKANASFYGNKIDISTVQSILENKLHAHIGPKHIQETTAKFFNISPSDLLSRKKERKISYPRQLAIFFTRKYTDMSLKEIGKAFGHKHHSSIIYSIDRIENDMKSKIDIINDINKLRKFILNDSFQ
jgi:chromosomal replication initiator protein